MFLVRRAVAAWWGDLNNANRALGLARLEYRGYDSAGLAVDGDKKNEVFAVKEVGKVASLKKLVDEQNFDLEKVFDSHAGIAHTRWATHGPPSRVNCHPHRYVASFHSVTRRVSADLDPRATWHVGRSPPLSQITLQSCAWG